MSVRVKEWEFLEDREDKERRDIKVTKDYLRVVDESGDVDNRSTACEEGFREVTGTV